jgi:hypothetical protein
MTDIVMLIAVVGTLLIAGIVDTLALAAWLKSR